MDSAEQPPITAAISAAALVALLARSLGLAAGVALLLLVAALLWVP